MANRDMPWSVPLLPDEWVGYGSEFYCRECLQRFISFEVCGLPIFPQRGYCPVTCPVMFIVILFKVFTYQLPQGDRLPTPSVWKARLYLTALR